MDSYIFLEKLAILLAKRRYPNHIRIDGRSRPICVTVNIDPDVWAFEAINDYNVRFNGVCYSLKDEKEMGYLKDVLKLRVFDK